MIAAVIELVDVASLRRLWRVGAGRLVTISPYARRADFLGAITALAGVLLFDTLPGLAIGIAVSLILLIARTSRPYIAVLVPVPAPEAGGPTLWVDVRRHPEATPVPGLLVLRVEAALIFANADFVRERVRKLASTAPADGVPQRAVILDGEATTTIDITAAEMLTQLRADLARSEIELAVANGIGQVRDVIRKTGDDAEPTIYRTIDVAAAALIPGTGGFTHNG